MRCDKPFILKRRVSFDLNFVILGSETHQAEEPITSVGAALVVCEDLMHLVTVVSFAGEQTRFGVASVELPVVSGVSTNMAAHD